MAERKRTEWKPEGISLVTTITLLNRQRYNIGMGVVDIYHLPLHPPQFLDPDGSVKNDASLHPV